MVRSREPLKDDLDQAYRGQDLVDPAAIRPCHTRRERLQRQEEAQQKRQTEGALPSSVSAASTIERSADDQPWKGNFTQSMDFDTLAMCDRQVTAAAQQSQLIPKQGPTPALVTPSYLTIVAPIDDTVLPAQEAMEVSAAFPYARGRRQEPIGERVIVNDLYGIPVYKPAVGPVDPDLAMGGHCS